MSLPERPERRAPARARTLQKSRPSQERSSRSRVLPTLATQSRKKWKKIVLPVEDEELAVMATAKKDEKGPDSDASESSGSTGSLASGSAADKTAMRVRAVDAQRAKRRKKTHGQELEEAMAAGTSFLERRAVGAVTLGRYTSFLKMFRQFYKQHDLHTDEPEETDEAMVRFFNEKFMAGAPPTQGVLYLFLSPRTRMADLMHLWCAIRCIGTSCRNMVGMSRVSIPRGRTTTRRRRRLC